MMRRALELSAVLATFAALVATSPAPTPPRTDCRAEVQTLQASSTCGPNAALTLTATADCALKPSGPAAADVPSTGYFGIVDGKRIENPTFQQGFVLETYSSDGGLHTCTGTAADAGMTFKCDKGCVGATVDGGWVVTCASTCEGALTP